jgi:putative membrane protein
VEALVDYLKALVRSDHMMQGQYPWCGGSLGYGTDPWAVGLTILFGLLVAAGIILLIVWAARRSSGGLTGQANAPDPALEVARRRFAGGEITKDQYDEIRHALSDR